MRRRALDGRALALVLALCVGVATRSNAQYWQNCASAIREVTLPATSIRLSVGQTHQLTPVALTRDGAPCDGVPFQYLSSNVNVVRIAANGLLSAMKPGVAIVTAAAFGGDVRSARAVVFVGGERVVPLSGADQPSVVLPPPDRMIPPFAGGRPPDLPRRPQVFVFRQDVDVVHPASDSAWLDQAGLVVDRLDDASQRLVDLFRNTAGVPTTGATSMMMLSGRERFRWEACGRVSEAFVRYGQAVRELTTVPLRVPNGAAASRSAQALAEAIERMTAVPACGEVARRFRSPGGDPDWASVYTAAASRFYGGWYPELRAVHEAARTLAHAVRPLLPPGRVMVIPSPLPSSPPTIGRP